MHDYENTILLAVKSKQMTPFIEQGRIIRIERSKEIH